MLKVLFIGHYREDSGWGEVARNYILALDRVGVDVVCRAIIYANNAKLPDKILELEKKDIGGCNVCIQNVLPHLMEYNSNFLNIGIHETETYNIKKTSWDSKLSLMDELWIHNKQMLDSVPVGTPYQGVPPTFDISKYKKQYQPLDIPEIKDSFCFYFVGEFNRRKNIAALIKAFHLEFSNNEPVNLVLKLNRPGMDENQLAEEVNKTCNGIKQGLGLYKDIEDYKNELVISRRLSDEELLRLHATMDCFVCTSFGEAWCIPAFEAWAMGNKVISSDVGGPSHFLRDEETGFIVESRKTPVFGADRMFNDFGTGRELWMDISILDLMKKMRLVYRIGKDKLIPEKLDQYSHENLGAWMKGRLECLTQ